MARLSATARPAIISAANMATLKALLLCWKSATDGSVSASCARKDLEEEFWSYCHTDENSDRVGELAFGTNLSLSDMIGVLLQDEKLPGVHLAFGDPYGSQTHARGVRGRMWMCWRALAMYGLTTNR